MAAGGPATVGSSSYPGGPPDTRPPSAATTAAPVSMASTGSAASVRPASRGPTAASVRRWGRLGGWGWGAQPRELPPEQAWGQGRQSPLRTQPLPPCSRPWFPHLSTCDQQRPFACPTLASEAARLEDRAPWGEGSAPQAPPTLFQKQVEEDGAGAHRASGQWQCPAWLRGPVGHKETPAHLGCLC